MTQAEKGNWDDDFAKSGDKQDGDSKDRPKAKYIKFDAPGDYVIRLAGNHVKFLRHWSPFNSKDRVITDKSYKGKDPAWNAGFYPRRSFAIHVIDRKDGQLKILEKGNQIFQEFARYKAINNANPAGKDGPDFVITVEIPRGNKKSTTYKVMPKNSPAPFTEAELAMIKSGFYPLADMYKSTPLERIQELWDAIPSDKKIPPPKKDDKKSDKSETKSETASAKVAEEAPVETAPTNDNDLFAEDPATEGSDSGNMF